MPLPDVTLARARLHRRVTEAVLALHEPFRSTVLLRYFEGRSSPEIAAAVGVPEGTVRWRLKKAIGRMPRSNALILIVDDDASVRASLALLLKQAGHRSVGEATPAEAIAQLAAEIIYGLVRERGSIVGRASGASTPALASAAPSGFLDDFLPGGWGWR